MLDPGLPLEVQVSSMACSTALSYSFWLILQLHFLEDHDLATVVHGLITYKFDYCNVLYMELPWETVETSTGSKYSG